MIPDELRKQWEITLANAELIFLADHGGGYPEVLSSSDMTPAARRVTLRRLGFQVAQEYTMPGVEKQKQQVPWVRLTNNVTIDLAHGFVSRPRSGGIQIRERPSTLRFIL